MHWRLQPYALEAATLCTGGCNPMYWRLQPYALEAATLCTEAASLQWLRAAQGGSPAARAHRQWHRSRICRRRCRQKRAPREAARPPSPAPAPSESSPRPATSRESKCVRVGQSTMTLLQDGEVGIYRVWRCHAYASALSLAFALRSTATRAPVLWSGQLPAYPSPSPSPCHLHSLSLLSPCYLESSCRARVSSSSVRLKSVTGMAASVSFFFASSSSLISDSSASVNVFFA